MNSLADYYHLALREFKNAALYLGHGTADLRDEAWWLVTGALGLPFDVSDSRVLQPEECQRLQELIDKRVHERIPTAYLLHEAYQNGYKFYVDQRVLIPRSPIAELIEQQFSPWIAERRVKRILDLCTGSGCLAILASYAFPEAKIDAADISVAALQVAERNVALHQLGKRLRVLESDLFEATDQYDVIMSNPPYVDAKDFAEMPLEYQHEPRLALAAGEDGLDIVRRILADAKAHLSPGGILIVEVGNSREALMAAYPNLPFIWLNFERGGEGVFLLRAEDL